MRRLAQAVVSLFLALLVLPAVAAEIVPSASRDVTPPGIMPGPVGKGPLVREAVPPRPPEPARWRRYFLPVTTDAATFLVKGQTIRVAGVTPPAAAEVCRRGDGSEWPCGRTALYALRMFLHGRAVECFFPFVEGAAEITAPCRVGKTDLGSWLLAAGWAKASELATSEYLTASLGARCARLGIWVGEAPPDLCPAKG